MLSSIRFRILVTCVAIAIVIAALAVSGIINYPVTRSYNWDSINQNPAAISAGHSCAYPEVCHRVPDARLA